MEALPETPKMPQPQRQVNKVLTNLVEKAVEIGEKKRRGPGGLGEEQEETGPAIEPSAHSEPLAAVRCLALSSDERHLFAGLASGHVIAVSATTGGTIATLEIGEGPVNAIAQITLRSTTVPEGGLETAEEEGGGSETEAVACKVLLVAAGEKVLFFKVVGVLEDNTFIQFAAAQLPRGTHSEAAKPPPPVAAPPQPLNPDPDRNGGDIKALGLAPDAGLFWASTRNGALAVFPMPSPTPPHKDTAETPPVTQLDAVFLLPPDSAVAAAGFARSHSAAQSPANVVNTHALTPTNELVCFLLRTASFREGADAKSLASSYQCELYVWWGGRNHILMYDVPWKSSASASKKEVSCEPRKAREWTMPHGVTSGTLSADGSLMAVGMGDGSALLLDLHLCLTHRLFQRLEGAITALAFTGQSAHRPPTGLVVLSSGGELKAHNLTGEKAEEKLAVAVRKGVTGVACLEGSSKVLLFSDDERPAQLVDVRTGAVLGSFAPGEGFACPRFPRDGTTAQRNGGTAEEQTGATERRREGPAERRNRMWAFSGGHVLVQTAQRLGGQVERVKEGGEGETHPDGQTEGPANPTDQPTSKGVAASDSDAPSECLVFHSLHSGALLSHSDTFAGLFNGPQLLERMLHDSASVRGKPGDVSRRASIMQSSPRSKSRHVSTSLPPTETLDPSGRLPYPPTMSRHVSVHEASGDSPRNLGHSSPRAFPFIRENSFVGVNKPLPLSQASLAGVNKPLAQGQLSLTRNRGAFTSSPRGDLASQSSPGGSPRGGRVKAGRIEGLPVAQKEEEPQISVGYRDDVPAMLNRLSSKGGGRFAREQRMWQRREEMLQELATNKVAALT